MIEANFEENNTDQEIEAIQTDNEANAEKSLSSETVENAGSGSDEDVDKVIDEMYEVHKISFNEWLEGLERRRAELISATDIEEPEIAPILSTAEVQSKKIEEKLKKSLERESILDTSYGALADRVSDAFYDESRRALQGGYAENPDGGIETSVRERHLYKAELKDESEVVIRVLEMRDSADPYSFTKPDLSIIFLAERDGQTIGIHASKLEGESRIYSRSLKHITHHIAVKEEGKGLSTILNSAADHYYTELQKETVDPIVWEVENRNALDLAWMEEHRDREGFTNEDVERKRVEQERWMHSYGQDGVFGFSKDNELYYSKRYLDEDFHSPDWDNIDYDRREYALSRDRAGAYKAEESGDRMPVKPLFIEELDALADSIKGTTEV